MSISTKREILKEPKRNLRNEKLKKPNKNKVEILSNQLDKVKDGM
jgi:hypothetical protein